jgi:ribosomal protein S18 acetylase RimI-like enzyme
MPSGSPPPDIRVCEAIWPDHHADAVRLVQTYVASVQQPACFPGLAEELADLSAAYPRPSGGFYLAWLNGAAVGCCAFRALLDADHANACEMKRLFVDPRARRLGLGHRLVEAVMDAARVAGYAVVLLDTLTEMEAARALYEDMGFVSIPPYTQSPLPGAHHLMATL